MSVEIRGDSNAGSISVDGERCGYAAFEERLHLYTDEPVDPSALAAAARALSERQTRPVVLTALPPPTRLIANALDIYRLRTQFDATLGDALSKLGVPRGEIAGLDRGGMPSEYRGFLLAVERLARTFAQSPESRLVQEVIFATRAVAFSTRYSHVTLWYTMSAGLQSLRDCLSSGISDRDVY